MSQRKKLITLNNEQRKHLAVTCRALGMGALIPVALSIFGKSVEFWLVVIWVCFAILLEVFALRLLKGVKDNV